MHQSSSTEQIFLVHSIAARINNIMYEINQT
jgi:hypothetical protein